jgi:hypothetical protein
MQPHEASLTAARLQLIQSNVCDEPKTLRDQPWMDRFGVDQLWESTGTAASDWHSGYFDIGPVTIARESFQHRENNRQYVIVEGLRQPSRSKSFLCLIRRERTLATSRRSRLSGWEGSFVSGRVER